MMVGWCRAERAVFPLVMVELGYLGPPAGVALYRGVSAAVSHWLVCAIGCAAVHVVVADA